MHLKGKIKIQESGGLDFLEFLEFLDAKLDANLALCSPAETTELNLVVSTRGIQDTSLIASLAHGQVEREHGQK